MDDADPFSRFGPLPGREPDEGDDLEWQQYLAWLDREIAAGRDRGPEPWASDAPLAEGTAAEGTAAEGTAAEGTAAEGREPECEGSVRPGFWQGDEADLLPPGPLLAGLTEQAVTCLGLLSDNELIGVLQATRRQLASEQYKQVLVTAEFGRRRQAAFTDAASRGIPVGCRPGGFPGEELASELVTSTAEAGHRIDDALDLTGHLPMTLAGMAAGQIDEARAGWIAFYTRSLSPADAARADEILADAAPDLRVEQLARKAAALEKRLNPEAVAARKEHAKRNEQRVEARRELSGNASLSGRELDTADVLAAKAHIDAIAVKLRRSGLVAGNLEQLRALAFADLTQGRNPLDRTRPAPAPSCSPAGPEAASRPAPAPAPAPAQSSARPQSASSASPAPLPALINLLVPVGTLLGLSDAPADAGRWGILDRLETQALVAAASRHPRTRWCVTLTAPDGTAVAHGCARGHHPRLLTDLAPPPQPPPAPPPSTQSPPSHPPSAWPASAPPPSTQSPPSQPPSGRSASTPPVPPAWPASTPSPPPQPSPPRRPPLPPQPPPPPELTELLRRLGVTFTPVASGSCDHAQAEDHYTPSRALRHLVRARTASCDAPGCQAPAATADLDHTAAWPDGPTDQCNLAPRCRTHHRAKQAPDWTVEQVAPGVTRWTLPSGRTHITTPTRYDV